MLRLYVKAQDVVNRVKSSVSRVFQREEGATAVEYALMVGLIAIVIILVVTALGENVGAVFNSAQKELADVPANQIQPS